MVDADTFLTALYVVVDDFCKAGLPPEPRPGPAPALSRSEVLTLGIFGQWHGFGSERGFYRYARRHLRPAFPALPAREQFNRHLRRHGAALLACLRHLAHLLRAGQAPYEVLDSAAVPTRDAKRRGAGWLPGLADIGWSNRLGWFEGLRLLLAVTPTGVVTGFGLGPASPKDQPLAETFFALRRRPHRRWAGAGAPAGGPYVADRGFEGEDQHRRWVHAYGAAVLCPPRRRRAHLWPKALRRWFAGKRQIVETVIARLGDTFRLGRERPHSLDGLQARLAAKLALHNFCIWLNDQLGRPPLTFADLIDW